MENEVGISVGVKKGNTTNWYKAHSLTRHPKGFMCVFALDENRTCVRIPAKNFAGVHTGIRCTWNKTIHPDILDMKEIPQETISSN